MLISLRDDQMNALQMAQEAFNDEKHIHAMHTPQQTLDEQSAIDNHFLKQERANVKTHETQKLISAQGQSKIKLKDVRSGRARHVAFAGDEQRAHGGGGGHGAAHETGNERPRRAHHAQDDEVRIDADGATLSVRGE